MDSHGGRHAKRPQQPRVLVAILVQTSIDGNGNTRRGWLIYSVTKEAERIAFVDAFAGRAALRHRFPDAVELDELRVTPSQWHELGAFDILANAPEE